ncbi:MAG: hypothetical protein KDC38_00090 [Planctomycetes bacterium]|nr:hypothetical protein [Planctomycetota bacterium]
MPKREVWTSRTELVLRVLPLAMVLASVSSCDRPVAPAPNEPRPVEVRGRSVLRGSIASAPDVSDERAVGYPSGRVVLVPRSSLGALSKRVGLEIDPARSRSREFDFDAGAFGLTVASGLLDSSGSFELQIPDSVPRSDLVLFVLNLGSSHPDPSSVPAFVYGWAPVTPDGAGAATLDLVYDGEARRLKRR